MSEFLDQLQLTAKAGHGGRGCVSFRREKYVPRGGPDGGNGGRGGHVILIADNQLTTLAHIRPNCLLRGGRGEHGSGNNRTGANGRDVTLRVPVGTVVRNAASGEVKADISVDGQAVIVARGGAGGRGNASFATPTKRAPRHAQPGEEGEELQIELELKLLADVGLVGFPNAGKSTLTARISAARPKIADYPFTTLYPVLGVVARGLQSFVVADIPGIIEGAHDGAGLGLRFLRHIERTRVLLQLVDVGSPQAEDPAEALAALDEELAQYRAGLENKPRLVVGNKIDLNPPGERSDILERAAAEKGRPVCFVSAATGKGIEEMIGKLLELLRPD